MIPSPERCFCFALLARVGTARRVAVRRELLPHACPTSGFRRSLRAHGRRTPRWKRGSSRQVRCLRVVLTAGGTVSSCHLRLRSLAVQNGGSTDCGGTLIVAGDGEDSETPRRWTGAALSARLLVLSRCVLRCCRGPSLTELSYSLTPSLSWPQIIRDLPCIVSILSLAKNRIDSGVESCAQWVDALSPLVWLLEQPLVKLANAEATCVEGRHAVLAEEVEQALRCISC